MDVAGVDQSKLSRTLAWTQGGYYLATGLWPILHLRSFEKLTGPKPEGWLTKTLGGVIAAVGATFVLAAQRKHVSLEMRVLGFTSALAFAVSDTLYPMKGRIAKTYLADALPQLMLAAGWLAASRRRSRVKHKVRAEAYEATLLTV